MRSAVVLLIGSLALAQDSPLVTAAKNSKRARLGARYAVAPELHTLRWFNSERTSLAAFRGQVVLVDFWATWCGPCVEAQPKIQQLAKDLGSSGLSVVLVHSRYTRQATSKRPDLPAEEILSRYIVEHHLFVPVAIADTSEAEQFAHGIPHYMLIDRKGFIRYDRIGHFPEEAEIRALLAE